MVQFCKKCGSIMFPKKDKLECPRCGSKSDGDGQTSFVEKVKKDKELEVLEEEKNAYPLVDQECPKCHHPKAYFWEIQTRASDEPATQFFKCERCKHTWRKYD